jgi:hypothetical protein
MKIFFFGLFFIQDIEHFKVTLEVPRGELIYKFNLTYKVYLKDLEQL